MSTSRRSPRYRYIAAVSTIVILALFFGVQDLGAADAAYPLKTGPTGRYLVDQNNVPFLMVGDSPQPLIGNVSLADAGTYFANRKALGFNTVWINLLCATYTHCRASGSTFDGISPFTTPGNLSTPNEAYFQRVDAMLNLAASSNILVVLDPIETGNWLPTLRNNGTTKARQYGQYLGQRYRSFNNILWMSGNDFQSWTNATDDALVKAVALGIKDVDDRHLQTVELDYPTSGSLDDSNWASFVDVNAAYTYNSTYSEVLNQYNKPNAVPVFMVEANYEFERNFIDEGTPYVLRLQEYWTMLSGAFGQLYGSYYTDVVPSGWLQHLNTPGALQFGILKNMFSQYRWYDLVPDQNHTVVTAGYGTYISNLPFTQNDYVTAAATADGSLVMAYLPKRNTVTVNMARLRASVTAKWFDPSTGGTSTIAGSPFANSGSRQFSPPGNNQDGDQDWVLILETASVVTVVTADSVTPASGAGSSRTFALQYSDTAGAADLSTVWAWFNGTFAASAANSCLTYYNRAAGTLFLLNDAGTAWMAARLDQASPLQNSQCAIALGGSTTAGTSGGTLTLNLAMSFTPAFAGPKNVYLYATNAAGINSGWQARGTWTVPTGAAVFAVTVTPASGSGSTQTFALQYSDTAGAADLSTVWAWFNGTFAADAANSCLTYYNRAAAMLFLLNDAGTAWMAARLDQASPLQNSQCAIALGGSTTAGTSGGTLTLNLAMTFRPAFAGAKSIYLFAASVSGNNSGWQERGTWSVPGGAVTADSVTPASGTGASQTFAVRYGDSAGGTNLLHVWAWISPTFAATAANSCLTYYNTATGTLFLLNDAGTAWMSSGLGGTSPLQNSQCAITLGGNTAVSVSGSMLTLNLAMTFTPAFAGAKNIYLYAANASGSNSAWQTRGTWTVPF